MKPGPWRARLILGLAIALLVLAASLPHPKRRNSSDLLAYYIPAAERLGARLRSLDLPLWNPEVACGIDQVGAAPQHALFYPPTWLHAWLPIGAAFSVLILAHLLFAGLGMLEWLRALGLGTGPGILASLTLVFGLIGEAWWPPVVYTLSYVPWLLFAIDATTPGKRRWCLGTLCVALQLLAGFPQHALYGLGFVGAYVLTKALAERSAADVAPAFAAVLLAFTIASIQLVPTALHLGQTERAVRLSAAEAHYLGGPREPGRSFAQDIGEVSRQALRSFGYRRDGVPQSLSFRHSFGYLGVLVPLLAAVAILRPRGWRTGFFALMAAAGLYLSLGHGASLHLYETLGKLLPFFGTFRTPDRLLIWLVLGLSALVGFGAQMLWGELPDRPRVRARSIVLLAASQAALAAACVALGYAEAETFLLSLGLMGVVLAAPWVEGSGAFRSGIRFSWALVLAACVTDLWYASAYVCRYVEDLDPLYEHVYAGRRPLLDRSDMQALLPLVGPDRIYVSARSLPVMRSQRFPSYRTLPYYEPLAPGRHVRLARKLQERDPLSQRDGSFGFWNLPLSPHLRWFDWSSVLWALTPDPLPEQADWQPRPDVLGHRPGSHLYLNRGCVPRASLFSDFVRATPEEALEWLASPAVAGESRVPRLEESPPEDWLTRRRATDQAPLANAGIEWLEDRPESQRLRVRCDVPSLLLVTDSWSPGWTCSVDHEPAPVLRANFVHRAVALLPGEHVVEFRYLPAGLVPGAVASVLGVCLLVGVALPRRRNRPD